MNFDWKRSASTRVGVVSWPSSEILREGRERAKWDLRTLDEVPSQELARGLGLLAYRILRPLCRSNSSFRGRGS